jgi:hypothetical protein
MHPLVARTEMYERILMEGRPGGGVSCFAYRSAASSSPAAYRFYDSRAAAEQGCHEDWGVAPDAWQTEKTLKIRTIMKMTAGCICIFGGALLLLYVAGRHGWRGLEVGMPAAGVVWFTRLSWRRPLEGGAIYVATICIAVALVIIGSDMGRGSMSGWEVDGLGLAASLALTVAALASLSSTLIRWSDQRRRLRAGSNRLQRASNGR